MKPNSLLQLNGLILGAVLSLHAAADPEPIVVCYPGGPVNEADANTAMEAMLRVIEKAGEWPAHRFNSFFTADPAQCKTLMTQKKPAFAITSLGLFLEQREPLSLDAIVQPRMKGATSERYHLMVQKGHYSSVASLQGKLVGGTVFEEPDFLQKIVFKGTLAPTTFFHLAPSRQAINALRSLDKGELDAVLLNGQQFDALPSLPLKSSLEAVFTSDVVPLMGLIANRNLSSAEDRTHFAKALEAMCLDSEGKKLCELFGIDAFVAVDKGAIDAAIALWKKGH